MKTLLYHTLAILCIVSFLTCCQTTDELSPADENNITGIYYDLIVDSNLNQTSIAITPYRLKYSPDDKIILTARAINGFEFVKWIGTLESTNPILSFNIKSNYKLKAVYKPKVVSPSITKPYFTITAMFNESTNEWDFKAQLSSNGTPIKNAKIGIGINTLNFDSFFEEYTGKFARAIDNSDFKITFSQPEIGTFSYTVPINFFTVNTLNATQTTDKKTLILSWQNISASEYKVYRNLTSPTTSFSEIFTPESNIKTASFTLDIASLWQPSISTSIVFKTLQLWVVPINKLKITEPEFDNQSLIEIAGKPTSKVIMNR